MQRFAWVGLAALLLTLVPEGATAQGSRPALAPGGFVLFRMMDEDFDGFASQLALTEEQVAQLQAVLTTFKESHAEPLDRMTAMVDELRAQRRQERPAPGAMRAIAEKHGHPQQELQPALHDFEGEVENVLTDDQQATLARMLQAQMGRRR